MSCVPGYWNHNAAYHPWILRVARRARGDVLDVGCGEGLLCERLAPVLRTVTGIDVDLRSVDRARERVAGLGNVTIRLGGLADVDTSARYDLVTFVATLHHMQLRPALRTARDLLAPGGSLLVVGLADDTSARDRFLSSLTLPLARAGSALHREARDIGVPIADPRERLPEIRAVAAQELPGVRVRRGVYYRYLLRWTRPAPA